MTYTFLNQQNAWIWRIVHRDNLSWVLDNGLHAGNSNEKSSKWVSIGNSELIGRRALHPVPLSPGGFLNDYAPFYFTPFSVMLCNIHNGRGDVILRSNEEIVMLVSSMDKIKNKGLNYLFTDSHAYYRWANYYSDLSCLVHIDWALLQSRDFRRDPDDPAKFERYQAEALVHQYCPIDALVGVVCYTEQMKTTIEQEILKRKLSLTVLVKPNWYF